MTCMMYPIFTKELWNHSLKCVNFYENRFSEIIFSEGESSRQTAILEPLISDGQLTKFLVKLKLNFNFKNE